MYSKIAVARSARVGQFRRSSSSICMEPKNDSIIALSNAEATRPIEPSRPASRRRCPNSHEGPAHYPAGVDIEDDRGINPTFAGAVLGDVDDPEPVRALGDEAALQDPLLPAQPDQLGAFVFGQALLVAFLDVGLVSVAMKKSPLVAKWWSPLVAN